MTSLAVGIILAAGTIKEGVIKTEQARSSIGASGEFPPKFKFPLTTLHNWLAARQLQTLKKPRLPLTKVGALGLEQAALVETIREGAVTPAPSLFCTKSSVEFQVGANSNFTQEIYGLDTKALFKEFEASKAILAESQETYCINLKSG